MNRIAGACVAGVAAAGVAACVLAACKGAAPPSPQPAPSAAASTNAAASGSASAAPAGLGGGTPCTDEAKLECATFDRAEDAFLATLASDTAVLAIGEAHAQRGATVASSAKRFTDSLLPLLAGRTSDLLVELMMPPKGCAKETQAMRTAQKPVTTQQAAGNQNEYVAMGDAAHKLGIVPDLLRPTCQDLGAVEDAGADAIDVSLATIARLTTTQAEKMIDRDRASATTSKKLVITYGGALHNDAAPPAERARWAYGPALSKYVDGRYVELDMYVPEFIEDTDTWRKLPWFGAYQQVKGARKATLFRLAPSSFVLIFAPTPTTR